MGKPTFYNDFYIEDKKYIYGGWKDEYCINKYNNFRMNNVTYPFFGSQFEPTGLTLWVSGQSSGMATCYSNFRLDNNDIALYNDTAMTGGWGSNLNAYYNPNKQNLMICFNLKKVSDITSEYFNNKAVAFYENYDFSIENVFMRGDEMTFSQFQEKYKDKYFINGFRVFDANNDLPRSPVDNIDTAYYHIPVEHFECGSYLADWDEHYSGNYSYYVPILRHCLSTGNWYFGNSSETIQGIKFGGSEAWSIKQWYYYRQEFENEIHIEVSSIKQTPNAGGNWSNGYQCHLLLFDLDYFVGVMNDYRIPFTFSVDEAINSKIEDFTSGYIPDGQPSDNLGGGGGNGDNMNDNVENAMPSLTPINSYNRMYAMNEQQLNNLQNYIWNSTFLDDLKLLFSDKSQAIIGLNLFPVNLTVHDTLNEDRNIVIGNVETEVQGSVIPSSYNCNFNGGTYHIKEYFGSAFDYAPYTQISLYIPYFGIKKLDTNDVMGKHIRLNYLIDLSSGMCQAQLWVTDDKIEKLLYAYDTSIAINIPISTNDKNEQLKNKIGGTVASIGGLVASASTGNVIGVATSGINLAKNVCNNRMNVDKGSSIDSFSSWYAVQTPYLIIERPIQSIASNYASLNGYPCNISATLSELKGYTECANVQLKNMSCTDTEKIIIKDLLEKGIIIG